MSSSLHEDQYTVLIISLSVILRVRNYAHKVVEKIKPDFVFNFFFLNPVVYGIMWKNVLGTDRPQMKIWRMRIE